MPRFVKKKKRKFVQIFRNWQIKIFFLKGKLYTNTYFLIFLFVLIMTNKDKQKIKKKKKTRKSTNIEKSLFSILYSNKIT